MKVMVSGVEPSTTIRVETKELPFDSAQGDILALHTILSEGGLYD